MKTPHGVTPQYLEEIVVADDLTRSPRSESKALLMIRQTAAVLWNNLPVNIRKCKTLNGFGKNGKTNLFVSAFLA